MNIAVVGNLGVVGSTISFAMQKLGHEVCGYDIKNTDKTLDDLISEFPEVIFVCVPTPVDDDGKCNTKIVREVVNNLVLYIRNRINYEPIIVIKSTVEPGTTKYLQHITKYDNVCFCPEFLRERCAIVDMVELHNLLAVGTHSDEIFNKIVECHGDYPKNTIKLTPTEAEFLKYYHNAIAALRIIFANEMFDLAEALGINYRNVKKALIKSTNLPNAYLDVSNNLRGFAGTCLPKDTLALLKLAENYDVDLDLLETVIAKNQKYQPTVYPGMRS